jgi:hypothetical protein
MTITSLFALALPGTEPTTSFVRAVVAEGVFSEPAVVGGAFAGCEEAREHATLDVTMSTRAAANEVDQNQTTFNDFNPCSLHVL